MKNSKKPGVKECSNHRPGGGRIYRVWNKGTAYRDGRGWYISSEQKEAAENMGMSKNGRKDGAAN